MELYRRNWEGPGCRHTMTLRATNNRFGKYPYGNIDVYYDARPITEGLDPRPVVGLSASARA